MKRDEGEWAWFEIEGERMGRVAGRATTATIRWLKSKDGNDGATRSRRAVARGARGSGGLSAKKLMR